MPHFVPRRLGILLTVAGLALWLGLLAGCQPDLAITQLSRARLAPGDAAPLPDKPALVLTGAISHKNQPDALALDLATLEQLELIQYTVDDPWQERPVTYTGVRLADLLNFAGMSPSATQVHIVAWDDYAADIPLSELERWPILVATRVEGATMSLEHGGPTRIIFPYQDHPDLTLARAMSVWNIREIKVQ